MRDTHLLELDNRNQSNLPVCKHFFGLNNATLDVPRLSPLKDEEKNEIADNTLAGDKRILKLGNMCLVRQSERESMLIDL